MAEKRATLEEARRKRGKSRRDRLANLTDEEIRRRALTDPDNPPLSEEQLEEFYLAEEGRRKPRKPDSGDAERSEAEERADQSGRAKTRKDDS